MPGNPLEDRLAGLEARLDAAISVGRPQAEIPLRELQQAELLVRKLKKKAGTQEDTGVSTYSSLCTSACFSSASTLCASGSLAAAQNDPEMAQVFATLHRRGVEVLGEEGLMEEMLAQAEKHRPINIFDLAKDGN